MAWRDFIYWLTIRPRLEKLRRQFPEAQISPCGSRYVCSPPKLTTDVDFLVYTGSDLAERRLKELGYKKSHFKDYHGNGYGKETDKFSSWRLGRINVILTADKKYADDFNLGTLLCRNFNVRHKYHRVVTYECLRGNYNPKDYMPFEFDDKLEELLITMTGPYGHAARKIYKIQHGSK